MNGNQAPTNENEAAITPAVSRLAVRLPPFWPNNPALWFAQVEANFFYSGVTADATKFALVVSQLEQQYAAEVQDIVVAPPEVNAYERLKSELIRRVSASQEERIRQVLTQEDIGDRRPSQYLRHLRSKIDSGTVPDNLLRTIWSSRLPPSVKAIIASQSEMPLDAVAELADKVLDAVTPAPHVVSAAQCASTATTVTRADYDALAARVDQLTQQISQLVACNSVSGDRGRRRYRRRSRSRATSSSPAPSPSAQKDVCWYHRRFGEQAQRCTKPCAFPNANGDRA